MRLKRSYTILGIFLIVWLLVLYKTAHFSIENPKKADNTFNTDIYALEKGVSDLFKVNNDIINEAHQYLESKKKATHDMDDKHLSPPITKIHVDTKIPVLVFACNRVSITRCLDKLIMYRPDPDQFPIIVSQDCGHEETTEVIRKYGSQVSLIQQPDLSDIQVPPKEKKFKGYFKIARHYGWALNQMFFNFNFSSAIIVEDDLEISPDFYEYFTGTYALLQKDTSLWCISAWNDNGKENLVDSNRPELLYRTDFFPGLGWMLTRSLWLELYKKWPRAYWDDWIREPAQRQGRSCIRPEISRTRTFGKIGVSNGMFYEKHLKFIKLNEQSVPFSKMNLTYLMKDVYDNEFVKKVYKSPIITYMDLKEGRVEKDVVYRIVYRTREEYKLITKKLGLMDDFKSGVPRTAYKGIVTFHYKGVTVHLSPNANWKGYDITWS